MRFDLYHILFIFIHVLLFIYSCNLFSIGGGGELERIEKSKKKTHKNCTNQI